MPISMSIVVAVENVGSASLYLSNCWIRSRGSGLRGNGLTTSFITKAWIVKVASSRPALTCIVVLPCTEGPLAPPTPNMRVVVGCMSALMRFAASSDSTLHSAPVSSIARMETVVPSGFLIGTKIVDIYTPLVRTGSACLSPCVLVPGSGAIAFSPLSGETVVAESVITVAVGSAGAVIVAAPPT